MDFDYDAYLLESDALSFAYPGIVLILAYAVQWFVMILPFVLVPLILFYKEFKFPFGKTISFAGAFLLVISFLVSTILHVFPWGNPIYIPSYSLFWYPTVYVYFIFYLISLSIAFILCCFAIKIGRFQLLYIFLILLSYDLIYSLIVSIIGTTEFIVYFPFPVHLSSLLSAILNLIVLIVAIPVIIVFMHMAVKPVIAVNTPAWKYMWIFPAFSYLILRTNDYLYSDLISLRYLIALSLIFTVSLLVFYFSMRMIMQIDKNAKLTQSVAMTGQQLILMDEHYTTIQTHIAETKRAEHDMRHHLSVIQSYISTGDIKSLSDYLNKYLESLPGNKDITFCDNFAVNSVLQYYILMAKKESIEVDVQLEVPETMSIPDSDLCIIFGNTVENAIEACRRVDGERYIKIRSSLMENMFTIIIANSFDGTTKKEGDIYMSQKHEGKGIGISSVKAVVEKYGESAQFETNGNEFRATIILCV